MKCINVIPEKVRNTEFYKLLKKHCGSNDTKLISYFATVATNDGFKTEFKRWYNLRHIKNPGVSFDKFDKNTIIKDVIEYYSGQHPNARLTVMKEYKSNAANYESAGDRRFCITILQSRLQNEKYNHKDETNITYDKWCDIILDKWFKTAIKKVRESTGLTNEDLKSKYNIKRRSDKAAWLEEEVGLTKEKAKTYSNYIEYLTISKEVLGDDISIQDKNLLASLQEMLDFHKDINGDVIRDKFFDDVFNIPELRKLRINSDRFKEADNAKEATAEAIADGDNVDESGVPIDLFLDETIENYSFHSGEYATFMMHLTENMQNYFNSVPVLRSTTRYADGSYDYDTDNAVGLSYNMNAKQCASMLYGRAKVDGNIEDFVESIREIAEQVPGYEGFIKIYDDLKGYSKDTILPTGEVRKDEIAPNIAFAEELFDVFAKTAMAKKELYIDKDGKLKARITNTMTSPRDSFRIQCLNSIKYSSIKNIFGESKDRFSSLKNDYNEIKNKLGINYDKDSLEYVADRRALIDRIYKSFKMYFPNITLDAVLNYVDNEEVDGKVDDLKNIDSLISMFNTILEAAQDTKEAYEARNKEAAQAIYDNELYRASMDEDPTKSSDYIVNVDAIYAKEYLQKSTKAAAKSFSNAFLPYVSVKTQFNSRNAAGNNSSDILNNSMLTYIKHLLENEDNRPGNRNSPLHTFAKYKFQSPQYDNSNFLIEHKENGKIVNLGLFRKIVTYNPILERNVTRYEPTSYATDLLKVTLFNGTADNIKNKAALYANMAKGDYLISALASFQQSVYEDGVEGYQFADYFLRTPSDAPKNFFFSLPKYSVNGLFVVENEQEVEDDIKARLNNITRTSEYKGKAYKEVNKDIMLNLLTDKPVEKIYLSPKNYIVVDDKAYATLYSAGTQIVVKGDLTTTITQNNYIDNIEVIGVLENDKVKGLSKEIESLLHDYYYNSLRTNQIPLLNGELVSRRINHNHPIYKQLFGVAKQEIQNAATALNALFVKQPKYDDSIEETVEVFVNENNEIEWNGPFATSDDPDNMTEINYHHAPNKKVFYKDNDGVIKLTGKVFTSDRFTKFSDIFDNNGDYVNSVDENYLGDLFANGPATEEDGRIHLLYGGHNTHLHMDVDGNVELTDAQKRYIERKLDKFVSDYVNATYERVNEFSNIMRDDVAHSYDDIAEFILNYRLAYCACADMLEGDSKCYKSFTDFLKRAKEGQGAGIPYSALDYTRMLCSSRTELKYSSLNEDATIKSLNASGKLHDARAYNVFRGVTVKNTVRTSKETQTILVDSLVKAIQQSYKANGIGITDEKAREKAEAMMKGYEGVKTNDAQSYITFEEWIRRISMRGQLPKYLPLIERLCDESKPLTINDINQFVQVQKNFYYDLYYNKTLNHEHPRQIKNAEFVLVPRLIKGTQLEEVYNTMIEHGIDQLNTVETSKAGKSNVLTLWDNNGNLSEEWFNAPIEKITNATELFDYNFLYTQQETPQHVNTDNKAAIQLMKRVVDNIPQYVNGKEHPLWKAKQRFQSLYAENIKESNADLLDRLNISYDSKGNFNISDKDGVLGMDVAVFCDMLKDELLRQAEEDSMLNYATLNTSPVESNLTANGFGLDTRMPLIANNSVRRKFESICQALFNNNITRQTLPGFHAAQVTGIGWRNTKDPVYNLISAYNDTELSKQLSYKEWKKLDKRDRVKYIPDNGIGVARDLKYHPAKYKNTKTGKDIYENDYLELSKKEQEDYVLDGTATFIEVRVPKSVFNFDYYKRDKNGNELRLKTDEELLLELQSAGLDEFVGYRIPTEGKQSIAVMKVAGFVDDSYGSTIIVPDDWVAQTGSDFDIDSVYAVVHHNRINKKTGRVEKIPYRTKFNRETYIDYIVRKSKNKITKENKVADIRKQLLDEINTARQDDFALAYLNDTTGYEELPERVQKIVKGAQQISKAGLTKQEVLVKRADNVIEVLTKYITDNNISQNEKEQIESYISVKEDLKKAALSDKYDATYLSRLEDELEIRLKDIEDKAKSLHLPTYEEYLELSTIAKNSKKARTNALVSTMIDILKSDWSLEENLSQSNFREVIKARDRIMSKHDKVAKEARSPYDFMAQMDNMEEAISGRKLKGVSVAYDNTVSICNTVHPYMSSSNSVTIIYSLEQEFRDNKGNVEVRKLDLNTLRRRFNEFETDNFGKEILDENGNPKIKKENVKVLTDDEGNPTGKVSITHNRFGWSNDNRNIDDFLITTYSSQTTAHQLDVIKEGAIPNVNDYTFATYKLFPAIGSDYNTAIAFMAQPGVTEIVNAYNRSKSIYSSRYEDPIRRAIINIANKFDKSIKNYVAAEKYLNDLVSERKLRSKNVLDYDSLRDRILGQEDLVFDYLVIKQFKDLKNISDKINAYSFIINPDKYGAKQSVFATREIFDKIKEINTDTDPVFKPVSNAKGETVTFLDAIFPNISNVTDDNLDPYLKNSDDDASVYKPLHYFMKYATAPSIVVNRRLFQTQHPSFVKIINSIKNVMSGSNPTLSEDTEIDFTSYVLSYINNNIDIIKYPIMYDKETRNIKENTKGSPLRERVRIYGFFKPNTGANFRLKENDSWVEFNPLDLNNPSPGDILKFLKFTPAQKVAYIQEHFDDGLACNYLTVNLAVHTKRNRFNPDGQAIVFDEYKANLATAREDFRQMFMNENPLVRLTAMDLIKYAYVVEGRSRARNTVGKLINDEVLIESKNTNGTGIVDSLKSNWETYILGQSEETAATLVEGYVRSHPTMSEISQCTFTSEDMAKYFSGRNKIGDMLTIIDNPNNTRDFILNKGIGYEEISFNNNGDRVVKVEPNHYINVNSYRDGKQIQTLYKIEKGPIDTQFVLIPLNLLEVNEFGVRSSNSNNNKHCFESFYKGVIDEWKKSNSGCTLKDYYSRKVTESAIESNTPTDLVMEGSTGKVRKQTISAKDPNAYSLVTAIQEHFNGFRLNDLYLKNKYLDESFGYVQMMGINGEYRYIKIDGVLYKITKTLTGHLKKYEHNDKPIEEEDRFMEPLINKIRSYNGDFNNIYTVRMVREIEVEDTAHATLIERPISELATEAHKFINHVASKGEKVAIRTSKLNAAAGIEGNVRSIKQNLETSLINTREYVAKSVDLLIKGDEVTPGFEMFWKDPDTGKTLTMTDPKVFAMMLDKKEGALVHRSFLKLYLDALRLIETFETFDYSSYTDQEKELQIHVDAIKNSLKDLKDNKIFKEAERLYVTEHLAKVSNNPNIQENIISLLEGYHMTNFVTAHINDLQDTSNPILQIITKSVMANIRAKELSAEEVVHTFERNANDILKRAREAGMSVNYDHFIDANGNWIDDVDDSFNKDLGELYQNTKTTYNAYKDAEEGTIEEFKAFEEYLNAKYEYDKFLLQNVNREIEDNYYHELLQNEDTMRYDNGKFLEVYVQYQMLVDKKHSLSKQTDADGGSDETIGKKLNLIETQIRRLISPMAIDEFNESVYKGEFTKSTGDENKDRLAKINSYSQSVALSDYLVHLDKIENEYHDYDEKESFRELLQRYLDVIVKAEDRDPITNVPRRSETDLANNDNYTYAKNWVRENATFKYGIPTNQYINLEFSQIVKWLEKYQKGEIKETDKEFAWVVASAQKYFEQVKGSKSNKAAAYKEIARLRNARDVDGVIDARKFEKEDLELIREEDLARVGAGEDNEFSERAIIRNVTSDVIYKKGFWAKMRIDGLTNPVYQGVVKNINSILRKAYNINTKELNTAFKLNEDDLEELLKQMLILKYNISESEVSDLNGTGLLNLLNSLKDTETEPLKKRLGASKERAKKVAYFIKTNTIHTLNKREQEIFDKNEAYAESRGESYYNLWKAINLEYDEENDEYTPNHIFWGTIESKNPNDIDKPKTAAVKALQFAYNNINSKYYEDEQSRVVRLYGKNSQEYKDWYELNHIYNPYTHTFEPLSCWTVHSVNDRLEGEWIPTYKMSNKKVRAGHENKNYKENGGYRYNYKHVSERDENVEANKANFKKRRLKTKEDTFRQAVTPDGTYDKPNTMNIYEKEMMDLFQATLAPLAKTKQSRDFLLKSAPIMAKENAGDTNWLQEVAKTFGFVDSNRSVYWDGDSSISYNTDYIPPMPMMQQLRSKTSINPPIREKYKTEEEYNKAVEDYEEHKEEYRQKNEEIHQSLLNRDYIAVISEFIRQAGHFNAIQDNKYQLFFGQQLLKDIKIYDPRSDDYRKLKKKANISGDKEPSYKTKEDKLLQEQYDNWLHRLIFNHYKQSQGVWGTIGNILQGFTSTSYMTLNLRAGIANVLVGDTNIISEAFAREYFGPKDWVISKKIWGYGIPDYLRHAYDNKADTKVGAIIKGINCIDYSELNGRITQVNLKQWSQVVNDLGFSINNAGEHMMQNSAMIAMMLSHKVLENPNYGEVGEGEYIVANFAEFTQNVREQILREVATEEQIEKYDKWIANIKKNPDGAKDFAWFREDPISIFIIDEFSKEQRKSFEKKVDDRKAEIKKEFDNAKSVYDQLDVDNEGYMCFAKGSIFEALNTVEGNQEISEAYRLLGEMKGRIISVNKKIHGNYGKLDAAAIEKTYLGRLIMQYHKHIPTGILKRYRRKGYFNEERGTVEKGMYVTLRDFLTFPVNAMKKRGEISDDEAIALIGLQNIYHSIIDYFKYLAAYSGVMPEYEVANMRRMLGTISGIAFALGMAALIKVGWDDDGEDSIVYNLLIYEMDRMASENFMWNPYGAFSEAKKQASSPMAAMSIVSDCQKILATVAGMIFEGEDYDPYYYTGRYAGRHKLGVYFERRLPYWRNYTAVRDIADNNHYYNVSENIFDWNPIYRTIEWISGE